MFPFPEYTTCTECGESARKGQHHVCDPQRRFDYRIAAFEKGLADWLDTNAGRFSVYDAERRREH